MSYVTRSGSQFMLDGKRFRFVGVNYYPLIIGMTSIANLAALFDACAAKGITVMRTWAFDAGKPPSDSDGNFRFLDYPLGTNLLSNGSFETDLSGWVSSADFTRSSQDAKVGTYSVKQVSAGGYNSFHTSAIAVTAGTNYVLTLWYKVVSRSGFGTLLEVKTGDLATQIKDCGLLEDTSGTWVRKQIAFNSGANTSIAINLNNFGGSVTAFFDNINLSLQQAPTLTPHEPTFVQLDRALDEANKRGIKLILCLADNTTNYDTKSTYITWANTIYGAALSTSFPQVAFYTDAYCKQLYQDFVALLADRVNTINGRSYKTDDTIFAWELGNEMRVDQNDTSGQNTASGSNLDILSKPGGWADTMSTYIKSIDPNHLVAFSSCTHTWPYTNVGDTRCSSL